MNSDLQPSAKKIESSALVVEKDDQMKSFGTGKGKNTVRNKCRSDSYHSDYCGKNGQTMIGARVISSC